jgi:hypothetical protein
MGHLAYTFLAEMNDIQVPEFETYEEEAAFWDNLDTAPFMEDDGEWLRFEVPEDGEPGAA